MDTIYEAAQFISCAAAIASGIDITLSAPDSIILSSNFEVALGGTLEVNNIGCND